MSNSHNSSFRYKVLIAEDDDSNLEMMTELLRDRYNVLTAKDGEACVTIAQAELPHLVLLDVHLPKLNGIKVCEALRGSESTRDIPVVMVTGLNNVDVRTRSYQTGADDFLSKPFTADELIARVESKLRRLRERPSGNGGVRADEVISCGNLILDSSKLEVTVSGKLVPMSVLEFKLLTYLVQNKERVINRKTILGAVWGNIPVTDRTIDTHLVSIRKKIEGCDHGIMTVYGAGYVFKKLA